jgi:hypothetical protein
MSPPREYSVEAESKQPIEIDVHRSGSGESLLIKGIGLSPESRRSSSNRLIAPPQATAQALPEARTGRPLDPSRSPPFGVGLPTDQKNGA